MYMLLYIIYNIKILYLIIKKYINFLIILHLRLREFISKNIFKYDDYD